MYGSKSTERCGEKFSDTAAVKKNIFFKIHKKNVRQSMQTINQSMIADNQ
jgi:hypothetical protein